MIFYNYEIKSLCHEREENFYNYKKTASFLTFFCDYEINNLYFSVTFGLLVITYFSCYYFILIIKLFSIN